jgi:hypothetical protein
MQFITFAWKICVLGVGSTYFLLFSFLPASACSLLPFYLTVLRVSMTKNNLVQKLEGKSSLGKHRSRWKDNVKVDIKEQ